MAGEDFIALLAVIYEGQRCDVAGPVSRDPPAVSSRDLSINSRDPFEKIDNHNNSMNIMYT